MHWPVEECRSQAKKQDVCFVQRDRDIWAQDLPMPIWYLRYGLWAVLSSREGLPGQIEDNTTWGNIENSVCLQSEYVEPNSVSPSLIQMSTSTLTQFSHEWDDAHGAANRILVGVANHQINQALLDAHWNINAAYARLQNADAYVYILETQLLIMVRSIASIDKRWFWSIINGLSMS